MATIQRGHRYINSTVNTGGRGHFGDVYGDVYNTCLCTQTDGQVLLLTRDPTMTPMVCLIDGLDECEQESVRWMASHLFELYRDPQTMKVRICVVSRDILELRHAKQILLDPDNNDKVDSDINTFTSLKMLDLTRRHNLSCELSSHIQAQLLHKAEGTFLWIGYAVSELLTKSTIVQVLDALEELERCMLKEKCCSLVARPKHSHYITCLTP